MTKKTEVVKEDADQTPAGHTLHPGAGSNGPGSESSTEMLARLLKTVSELPVALRLDINDYLNQQIGHEADLIPVGASAGNKATILAKPSAAEGTKPTYTEDVAALFGTQELSEEFKTSVTSLFGAAVEAKVIVETAAIQVKLETEMNEKLEASLEDLVEKLDGYLDLMTKEWMTANEIALTSTLKSEITEEFIKGLHQLFQESYIEVPDEKIDLVTELTNKVETLEATINGLTEDKVDLTGKLTESTKVSILADVSRDLSANQSEELKVLAESVEFTDAEAFVASLNTLKEKTFKVAVKTALNEDTGTISDPVEGEDAEKPKVSAEMKHYVDAISRTIVK